MKLVSVASVTSATLAFLAAWMVLACSGSTSEDDDAGDGDGDLLGGDGDGDGDLGDGDAPGTGGETGGGNPDPILCGGAYDDPCAEGKYCRIDGACGSVGNCVRRPSACDDIYQPVCGCDGRTYSNECEAAGSGVAIQFEGECGPIEEFVVCGEYLCGPGQYCQDSQELLGGTGGRLSCRAIPDGCGVSDVCSCLEEIVVCLDGSSCAVQDGLVTQACL